MLFNQKILVRLKNCFEHNPFKIWYLEYPVFQGWVSFNEYDILILNVSFAINRKTLSMLFFHVYKYVKIALKVTKSTYNIYCNKLCLILYPCCFIILRNIWFRNLIVKYTSCIRQNEIEILDLLSLLDLLSKTSSVSQIL